jgi:hypothetical protein
MGQQILAPGPDYREGKDWCDPTMTEEGVMKNPLDPRNPRK